jgi:uncharacterized protein YoxC
MPAFTYPDGFPQNPLDAINFSYFLSDTDKAEWREWIKTATPEQQFELVDTLHSMWLENQKNAVPVAFDNSANAIIEPQPAQAQQALSTEPQKSDIQKENVDKPLVTQPQSLTNNQSFEKENPQVNPNTPKYDFTKDDKSQMLNNGQNTDQSKEKKGDKTSALMNFGPQKYSPSAVLDDSGEIDFDPFTTIPDKEKEKSKQLQKEDQKNKEENKNQGSNKTVFNIAKIRESATRKALEEIYASYNEAREKSYLEEKTYRETQGEFMDKVMKVVVNFEQVADFFDSMTQKLLEMNDKLVQQVKDYSEMKSKLTSQQADLSDQVEEIRRDVDRLYREVRDGKSETRRKIEEIDGQMASFGADAYRQDGILQRLDLIMSRLHKVELNVFRNGNNQSNQHTDQSTTTNSNSEISDKLNQSQIRSTDNSLRPSLNPSKPISINVKK